MIIDTADALDEIRRVVEIYKPAHLSFAISHQFTTRGPIVIAGAITNTERIFIKQQRPDKTITARGIVANPIGVIAVRSNWDLHY